MDYTPLPAAPKLPVEIQNVINNSTELLQAAAALRSTILQIALTSGITPQEFKERASTEYVQNLFVVATGGITRTQASIADIPDTHPT
jgi:hypothetical protein